MKTLTSHNLPDTISKNISESKDRNFSLRMAPMIDIIFLLLIFFLVAGKWRPQENFLPIRLPAANASQQLIAKPEPLMIYISPTKTGCNVQIAQIYSIQIENENIEKDLVFLMEKLNDTLLKQKRYASDPIEITCLPKVKWDLLAKIYNLFYGMGLTDITFAMTELPDNGLLE